MVQFSFYNLMAVIMQTQQCFIDKMASPRIPNCKNFKEAVFYSSLENEKPKYTQDISMYYSSHWPKVDANYKKIDLNYMDFKM